MQPGTAEGIVFYKHCDFIVVEGHLFETKGLSDAAVKMLEATKDNDVCEQAKHVGTGLYCPSSCFGHC